MSALADLTSLVRQAAVTLGRDPASLTAADIEAIMAELPEDSVEDAYTPLMAEENALKFNRFASLFPDAGDYPRSGYPKHMEFFAAGKKYRERMFMAANRVGKTVAGAYEMTAHLTGLYPHWWEGHTFRKPVRAWAAGDTNETTRDIIQLELLGTVISGSDGRKSVDGSGMIPRQCIGAVKWKAGVQDLVDTIYIRHVCGSWSSLGFKSFDQGRRSFQGTAKEAIWLDEECPEDVWNECFIRTATTKGRLLGTYTPLNGMTQLTLSFLPGAMKPGA